MMFLIVRADQCTIHHEGHFSLPPPPDIFDTAAQFLKSTLPRFRRDVDHHSKSSYVTYTETV